nr:MAG TPA: hypothetical protein [Caudoviricetes sp.]
MYLNKFSVYGGISIAPYGPKAYWTAQRPELTGHTTYLCIISVELLCTTDHMSEIATIRLSRISNSTELL